MVRINSKGVINTSVLGFIAEFNPLHNGHLHFIKTAQEMEDFSATICVMSGNFVQRGEAAVCNKWVRARMALAAGVDLVLELPFCFAVRSAYYFARGGIELLNRTGVVSHLAFGSESGHLEELQSIAKTIAHETQDFKNYLKNYLAQGLSFPVARARTIQFIMGESIPDLEYILMQPNNILALEYLRVLEQEAWPLLPITIPRIGSGYHTPEVSPFASATAIRYDLLEHRSAHRIKDSVPPAILTLLEQEMNAGRAPVSLKAFESAILAKLRTTPLDMLRLTYETSEGLEHRIQTAANSSGTLEELIRSIKSKRYSSTRINRLLLYIMLDIQAKHILNFDQHGPLYMHILGFSTQGRKILQEIKNKSALRLLNRGSEVKGACHDIKQPALQAMLALDVKATDIYTLLYPQSSYRHGSQDFTTSPIIIGD